MLRQSATSSDWTTVWQTSVPRVAAGQTLQLVVNGHDVWLLSTGSPSAGLMPKLLWASQNDGKTWRLVASGDLAIVRAPFIIPRGYPTGIVVTKSGLLLSISPRGNGTVAAVSYTLQPLSQHLLTFSIPQAFRPVIEALPAIVGPEGLRMALVESSPRANGYLALATPSLRGTGWVIRSIEPLTDNTPSVLSGPDDVVMVNTDNIQVFSPGRRILTLAIRKNFVKPLVATAIAPQTLVVLGKNGILWTNQGKLWHHFNN